MLTLVEDLEQNASWRREKADQYPNDHRNVIAAEILERLMEEVGKLNKDSLLLRQLEKIDEELLEITDDLFSLSGDLSDYHRGIGFHSFPESAEEYLTDLIDIYSANLAKANEVAQEAVA
jgi:hypothetical protein